MNKQLAPKRSWREGVNYPTPVQKVLSFGYYDGPTEGVLQCEDGQTYRFDLLTWEPETQDLRVFSLSSLPRAGWDQLIALCASRETPRWPIWVPSWHEGLNQPVKDILRQAGPVEWVVATTDLQGEMLCVKATHPQELVQLSSWRMFLGLAQELPLRISN